MRVFMILIYLLIWSIPARADFAAGMGAYEAGDFVAAREAWHPLAEAGDPRAQYWMGDLYRFGKGVAQDFKAAMGWYKQAARQTEDGDMLRRAAYALGYMVKRGQGAPKDLDKAECLYRVAAENGYANAQFAYSRILRDKPGIDFNAFSWIERAAKQGQDQALFRLGDIEVLNPGIDDAIGYMHVLLALKRGNEFAMERIAVARKRSIKEFKVREALQKAEDLAGRWRAVREELPAILNAIPPDCWP
ncbi:tetratricopeptide repeat protein [Magnetospira sp. QH-2]|uniref:tetratricopeptide repeat protein n=1 Tax=Magnetospira sp. (strain QH-2) TaxID=1288970 RepID=UPI0003E819FE|nr:tetratricopeptide repeat protein [Magnetospira sp. QH-2]CCQ72314.1 exported protein of unknown function [Magnetospira sp. QH-2]